MMKTPIVSILLVVASILLSACNLGAAQTDDTIQLTDQPPLGVVAQMSDTTVADLATSEHNQVTVENGSSSLIQDSNPSNVTSNSSDVPNSINAVNTNYPAPASIPNCIPRSTWPYVYTVVAGDTLYRIARRTQTTVDTLVSANCLDNANVLSVGATLYVPNSPTYQPQLNVSAISPTISRSHLQSDNPLFDLSWTVTDRPPNSNLRFEQRLPNGELRNIELPRFNPYVASTGDGQVRLIDPVNVNQLVIVVTLFDTNWGTSIVWSELVVNILSLPPLPPRYACYVNQGTPIQVYSGFQGTGNSVVGTIPANTQVEVVTREFNGYYGLRYSWGDLDIAWASISVQGDCSDLPDFWHYTGHGQGDDWTEPACYATSAQPTELFSVFQGSSATVVATIPAGMMMEVISREFNGYYGVRYGGQYDVGWTDPNSITPQGDCADLSSYNPNDGHGSGLDDDGQTCMFVGDTTVPIYGTPQIGSDVLHTLQNGERYLFNAYGDLWQSGDVTGHWIEIFYNVDNNIRGYVQNTGGHLEGALCLTN